MRALAFILMVFLLIACERADRDPVEPLLPQYSELGVGAAGAIFNNEHAWTDICSYHVFYDDCQYINVRYDTINAKSYFSISGELFGIETPVKVGFELNNVIVRSHSDLKALEGQVIDLDGVSGRGVLIMSNEHTENNSLVCQEGEINSFGKLHIRKVGVYSNPSGNEYAVLAGTFGFDLNSICWSYSMYQGRFDYEISGYSSY